MLFIMFFCSYIGNTEFFFTLLVINHTLILLPWFGKNVAFLCFSVNSAKGEKRVKKLRHPDDDEMPNASDRPTQPT